MSIKNYQLLLLFFILEFISNSEIIIEFNSKLSGIPKNLTPLQFLDSLISNELYINLNIGNPSQNLQFLLDFDSYHTYIIKDNNILQNDNKIFHNSSSSTFKTIGKEEYFQNLNFFKAISCTDLITINEKIKDLNYTFLYIQDKKLKKSINYPGVIGMGVVSNGEPFHHEVGLIYQLKNYNITNNYLYTLVFNDNNFNGKIILEKNIYENYSIDNFVNDYCIITYEYEYYWGWNRINSYYGSTKLEIQSIYLRPELGVIVVNLKIKDILKNIFFDEKIKEGKCYEEYKSFFSFFYCDTDVIISIDKFYFQITKNGPQVFFLDSNDLTIEYNNKKYFLMVFQVNFPSDQAYFGYPFFKKFDVIFNQDSRNVGFYNLKLNENKSEIDDKSDKNDNVKDNNQNDDDKNNDNDTINNKKNKRNYNFKKFFIKLLFVIFIILLILFIFYFIFYIYRKIKRKSNEKLYEEFNDMEHKDNDN